MSIELVPRSEVAGYQRLYDQIVRSEKSQGLFVSQWAKESLARLRIHARQGEEPPSLAWITGEELGSARKRMTEAIHREGARRRLLRPTPDAALLFRDAFPMELQDYRQIVFMHKPIRDCDQHPSLLCWERKLVKGTLRRVLSLPEAYPGTIWPREAVFIFRARADWTESPPKQPIEVSRTRPMSGVQPRPCWTI